MRTRQQNDRWSWQPKIHQLFLYNADIGPKKVADTVDFKKTESGNTLQINF